MSTANLFKKVNSSDYINYKKCVTIANEYSKTTTTNPVKLNGNQYNKNFAFIPTFNTPTTDLSNCLIYAKNHELKQDYSNGVTYLNLICDISGNT